MSALAQARASLTDRISDLSFTTLDVVLALAVIIVAWLLSRVASRGVTRAIANVAGVSDDLRVLAARTAGYLVLFIGVGIALSLLGAQIQPLLTVALLVGVVLALALRGIADNFAAGIVIQTRRPVSVDDEIEALGYQGLVRDLNSRAVVIETHDGRTVHLPNRQLLDGPIVNHSATGRRRADVEVRLRRTADDNGLSERLSDKVATVDGVLADPAPVVLLASSEPDRMTFIVRVWHHPSDGAAVTSAVIAAVGRSLRDDGQTATVVTPRPATPLTPPPAV